MNATTPQHAQASLKAKTALSLLLLGLGLVLGSGAWRLSHELSEQTERLHQEMSTLPLLFAEPLARSVLQGQAEHTQKLLKAMVHQHGVQWAELRGNNGLRISTGRTHADSDDALSSDFLLLLPQQSLPLGQVKMVAALPTLRGLLSQATVLEWVVQHVLLTLALVAAALWLQERLLLRHMRQFKDSLSPAQHDDDTGMAWQTAAPADDPEASPPQELQDIQDAFVRLQRESEAALQAERLRNHQLQRELEHQTLACSKAEQTLDQNKRELAMLNRQDALTGLANRREFDDALRREFKRAQREQSRLALAILDLDHLKAYNELHGHTAGDELMKHFAQLLARQFQRDTDVVARLGGEEFAALLPGFDAASAQGVLESLREQWHDMAVAHGASPVADNVTVSIGLAIYRPPMQPYLSGQALLQAADEALSLAKHTGRDKISLAA